MSADVKAGVLSSLPVDAIVAAHGSPVLVLSARLLAAQVDAFLNLARRSLPSHSIFYSVKTNDVPQVLEHLAVRLAGLEIVSAKELAVAQRWGVGGDRLILNGPNRSDADLDDAIRHGVGLINVDGLADAERLQRAAERRDANVAVGLRLGFKEDRVWEKFGVSPDGHEFRAVLALLGRSKHLRLVALHHHGDPFLEGGADITPLLLRIADARERATADGFDIHTIDLGGGWEPVIDIDDRGDWRRDERTERLFESIGAFWRDRFEPNPPHLVLEPGRALVEGVMFGVGTIGNIKRDRGTTFVFVDLSSGFLGGRHPCDRRVKYILDAPSDALAETCSIAGPMCYGSDVLGEADLREPRDGQRLIMANAGAYTLTMRWHSPLVDPTHVWVQADGRFEAFDYPITADGVLNTA